MSHTALTLICNPAAPALDADALNRVSEVLRKRARGDVRRATLADAVAADFLFDPEPSDDTAPLTNAVREALGTRPVDIVVQPAAERRKKLLIADMDSTIIEQECIDELADFVGKRSEISAITERAMRGELDFEEALKERAAMLRGLPAAKLQEAYDRRITLQPGAKTLVATMNRMGAATILVSGGFTFFTTRVAAACGFQETQANDLLTEDGALTGEVREPILGRAAKEEALIRFAEAKGAALSQSIAVGDGANDLSMMARAGLGVAFHAKPVVAEAADARIEHGDLTALLYLQGYKSSAFSSA